MSIYNNRDFIKSAWLCAGLSMISAQCLATITVAPFKATYSVQAKGFTVAKVDRSIQSLAGGRYTFRSESRPVGPLALIKKGYVLEQSFWKVTNDHIEVQEYNYNHSSEEKRNVKAKFDWKAGKIFNTGAKKQTWTVQMKPQTQVLDKMVYQLAIMYDLQAGKKTLDYQILDGRGIKDYKFVMLGEEELETPLGKLKTLKFRREKANAKRIETFWAAPDYGYLPVRLDNQEKDGVLISVVIEELQGLEKSRAQHKPEVAEGQSKAKDKTQQK